MNLSSECILRSAAATYINKLKYIRAVVHKLFPIFGSSGQRSKPLKNLN